MIDQKKALPAHAISLCMDGNMWMAVWNTFENLQESDAGFGEHPIDAVVDLARKCMFCDGNGTILKDEALGYCTAEHQLKCAECESAYELIHHMAMGESK